ncbi:unnamed protein product [Camellia sinensis]
MGSIGGVNQPHAVCLLHLRGFHITFVNTEYNHNRLLRSTGPNSLDGLPDFRFETIPDGLPPSDADSTQDIPSLCDSTSKNCLVPFSNLISKLNDASSPSDVPPVTCVVSDACMSFTLDAAEEFGVPEVLFWTPGACGVLGYSYYKHLMERELVPLKDASFLANGYLDTTIDWIPRMNNIRLKDLPTFIRTTGNDPNHFMLNFLIRETDRTNRASAIVINTFHELERAVVDSLSSTFIQPIYTIGPLHLMLNNQISACIDWLNSQQPNSVVYVNFGSITIIRADIVSGDTTILPPKFVAETKDRGVLASWCPQEQVLNHPSIGGFLTHSGWNSTIESVSSGVPMICWPFFAEQQMNCRYSRREWGIGLEIDSDVKPEVENLVRELMEGEKGKEMKKKAMEWKKAAEEVAGAGGSSSLNLDKLR